MEEIKKIDQVYFEALLAWQKKAVEELESKFDFGKSSYSKEENEAYLLLLNIDGSFKEALRYLGLVYSIINSRDREVNGDKS